MPTTPKKPKKKTAATKSKSKALSPQRIMEMTWGFAPSMILATGVQLGVFDALDSGPKSIAVLASKTGASVRGLTALAEALAGLGFLTRRGQAFSLTPEAAAFLVSSKPGYMGGLLNHIGKQLVGGWLDLPTCVMTGKPVVPVNQEGAGSDFFKKLVENIFNMSFAPAKLAANVLIGKSKAPQSVLDIAAGSGVWGIAMALHSPRVTVTAVDWPDVIPVTKTVSARHGVADRFTFVEGDIKSADFGSGHTIATLGHILHSEGEARSHKLLARVAKAMARGGTIVIGEFIPDEQRTSPAMPLIFAVNMLVNTDEGNTYTFKQMSSWLKEAGFKNPRLVPSPGPSPLLMATRA